MGGTRKSLFLALVVVAALFVHSTAIAAPVLFDFDDDDLPYLSGAAKIEAYMEKLYGSDITVTGSRVGNGIIPGALGDDHYLQAGPAFGAAWFSFSFDEVPIIAASFDWAVELNSFHAYADGEDFFSHGWGIWSSGNTGTICFDPPVTTLKFSNSNLWEIEVDNLVVTPVPEPATVFLLGAGAAFMVLTRKRRAG